MHHNQALLDEVLTWLSEPEDETAESAEDSSVFDPYRYLSSTSVSIHELSPVSPSRSSARDNNTNDIATDIQNERHIERQDSTPICPVKHHRLSADLPSTPKSLEKVKQLSSASMERSPSHTLSGSKSQSHSLTSLERTGSNAGNFKSRIPVLSSRNNLKLSSASISSLENIHKPSRLRSPSKPES